LAAQISTTRVAITGAAPRVTCGASSRITLATDAREFAETKHKGLPEEKQAVSEQHVQAGGRNPTLEMVNSWLGDIRQGKVNFAEYRKRLQEEQAR
jgi:hypothetical protein